MLAAGVLAVSGAAGAAEPSVTRGGPVSPAQWPASVLAAPGVEGWPNALRIWGPDRYQTSLAGSLVLRGSGAFPFDSPDHHGGAGNSLSNVDHWWGLGVCPKAVVIVAGDSQADALAAAALSDPTGGSSEPYLQRVAAADLLFDPLGGFARVDTQGAPMLVTHSTRNGARSLAVPVRLAARDLRLGGCNTARQAIIVGGPAAVPSEIEAELVSIGITEVFRVAGENRYGTAAAVAHALGTAPVPDSAAGCATTRDGGAPSGHPPQLAFWANSVVEWRNSPTQCRLLGRTVVLTDGIEGIDALAAGWWTSYWQVPVLLGDGSNRLPAETVAAMTLLDIDHIIAVGGTARLPDVVVDQAARLTGAQTLRVAGPNRYATSVEMAKRFGGWWPNGDLEDGGLEGAVVCIAASGGARSSLGWPDALGAGAWCGTAAAAGAVPPGRMLGTVTSSKPPTVAAVDTEANSGGASRQPVPPGALGRGAVPLILVPSGSDQLPPSVELYLEEMFAAPAKCTAFAGRGAMGSESEVVAYATALEDGTCPAPGFAVAFGGPAAVTPAMLGNLSSILSGRLTSATVPEVGLAGAETPDRQSSFGLSSVRGVPLGVGAYATTLTMTPVFHSGADVEVQGAQADAGGGLVSACVPRGSYPHARWLNLEALPGGASLGYVDLTRTEWYRSDHDGQFRSVGEGAPGCIDVRLAAGVPLLLRAVDPLGRSSRTLLMADDASRRFGVTAALEARNPETSGPRSDAPQPSGVTRWVFETDALAAEAEIGDAAEPIRGSRLQIDLRRRVGADGAPATATFRAEWFVRTANGRAAGTANGEAVLRGGRWLLRGASVLTGGNWVASVLGSPGQAVPEPFHPVGPPPVGAVVPPLRVGTSGGYGAGGFSAEITLNGQRNSDDTISWQPEAFINVAAD